ncbi:MAG: DnaA regulatory inactivator Hda [Pseudomonadales bacterium]|nr:DnaA regulatory inactivator Hda [Pseudomonadales bacterium]
MSDLTSQITLGFAVDSEARFENFLPGSNTDALFELQDFISHSNSGLIYLWGSEGTGCSHLLQAATHESRSQGHNAVYIPAEDLLDSPTSVLENLQDLDLVCIDNFDKIAGDSEWETAIFHLYNRLAAQNAKMVVGALASPRELGIKLSDLKTRLQSGLTLRMDLLSDYEKMEVLQYRAQLRGMELPEKVAHYILSHSSREMPFLIDLLGQLDAEGLRVNKKKLTIPVVKTVLEAIV